MRKQLTMADVIERAKKRLDLTSDNQLAAYLGISRQRLWTWKPGSDLLIVPKPEVMRKLKTAAGLSEAEMKEVYQALYEQKNSLKIKDALRKTAIITTFFLLSSLMDPEKAVAQGPDSFYITQLQSIHYTKFKAFILSLLTGWARFLRIYSGIFLTSVQYG